MKGSSCIIESLMTTIQVRFVIFCSFGAKEFSSHLMSLSIGFLLIYAADGRQHYLVQGRFPA